MDVIWLMMERTWPVFVVPLADFLVAAEAEVEVGEVVP